MKANFNTLLKELSPDSATKKKVTNIIKNFIRTLDESLKKNKVQAKVRIGGSFAKGTWLREEFDVDLFVVFDRKHSEDDLSMLLEQALPFKNAIRVHGSRDYYQLEHEGLHFEIVPVLALSRGSAHNVTDYSPGHVVWVKKHLTPKLRDEILLAKQFFKAHKLYGAESYLGGFSGHVLDILIIKYKGLQPLLKKCITWKGQTIIDTEKRYKTSKQALHHLNTSKTRGPLIIIDPVQKERNAASAVTLEKVILLQQAAKKYLKKPSVEHFKEHHLTLDELRKKKNCFIIEARPVVGKRDVVGSKLLKLHTCFSKALDDFGITSSGWEWNGKEKSTALYWYCLKKKELAATYDRAGPPVKLKKAVIEFKKKHKKTVVKKGRVCATVKRECRTAEECIGQVLQDKDVKKRAKKVRVCPVKN